MSNKNNKKKENAPTDRNLILEKQILELKNQLMTFNQKNSSLEKLLSKKQKTENDLIRNIFDLKTSFKETFFREIEKFKVEIELDSKKEEIKNLEQRILKSKTDHKKEIESIERNNSLDMYSLKTKIESLLKRLETTDYLEEKVKEYEVLFKEIKDEHNSRKEAFLRGIKNIEVCYHLKHDYFKEYIYKEFESVKKETSKMQIEYLEHNNKLTLLQNQKYGLENDYLYEQLKELFAHIKKLEMVIYDYKNQTETLKEAFEKR